MGGETSFFTLSSSLPQCELGSDRSIKVDKARLTEAAGRPGMQLDGNATLSLIPQKTADPLTRALSELTIALWVHADSVPTYPVYLERLTNGGRAHPGFFYFYSQTRQGSAQERETDLRLATTNAAGERRLAVSTLKWKMTQGEWHHIACVFKDGGVTFYLNGAPLGQEVPLGEREILEIAKPVYLRAGAQFTGLMAGFLIAPRALDADAVASLHETFPLDPDLQATLP